MSLSDWSVSESIILLKKWILTLEESSQFFERICLVTIYTSWRLAGLVRC